MSNEGVPDRLKENRTLLDIVIKKKGDWIENILEQGKAY